MFLIRIGKWAGIRRRVPYQKYDWGWGAAHNTVDAHYAVGWEPPHFKLPCTLEQGYRYMTPEEQRRWKTLRRSREYLDENSHGR